MTSSNGNILPHKGQWRGALMSSLICVWINGWENKRKAGDLTMKIWWCIASDRQILWPQLEVVFGSHVGFRYLILAFHHFSRPIFWKWTQEGPGNQNFSCYQFFIIIYIYIYCQVYHYVIRKKMLIWLCYDPIIFHGLFSQSRVTIFNDVCRRHRTS